ncbi:hypothetical protein DN554_30265, partial [Burkholderia multivorans]|uniref:hypothetical protein n=1 Tax=Burkholderia multivorans TaxID=87883 RepID=UPI000DAF5282
IVTGHLLSYLMRVGRVPGVIAVVGLGVVLATVAAWLIHPETFSAFLPSGATWDAVAADLTYTREQFSQSVAPVAYEGPWAMLGLIGVVLVVLLGDTFAFRAHGRGEALVPGAVLFVFVAALGTDRGRVRLTLLL